MIDSVKKEPEVRPLFDFVLLEPVEEDHPLLALPDSEKQRQRQSKGRVRAVGPDCKSGVKVGDVVLLLRVQNGGLVRLDGEDDRGLLVSERGIMGVEE